MIRCIDDQGSNNRKWLNRSDRVWCQALWLCCWTRNGPIAHHVRLDGILHIGRLASLFGIHCSMCSNNHGWLIQMLNTRKKKYYFHQFILKCALFQWMDIHKMIVQSQFTSFSFDYFNANVIIFWTCLSPISNTTPMEIFSTARCCGCTSIAPNCVACI